MKATDELSFGTLLRNRRHAAGLTQEELAERARLSVQTISTLERGTRHTPHRDTVQLLAEALELETEERARFEIAARRLGPGSAEARARARLPLPPTPFIGREREVAAVTDLLRDETVRLLTLTGTGGSGKTRLAIQAAQAVLDAFPDGVVFTDPALVAATIAAVLDARETSGHQTVEALQDYLGEKRLLLLLDNFEYLLPAATTVGELLAACPQLAVLVTSRAVLHLAAEHTYAVPPLAVPDPGPLPSLETLIRYDAVRLFVERARAARASFCLTDENAPAVVEICRRLDGLPLAIQLAAARTRLFPPKALLGRLESRMDVLTGGARDIPARQQTLRNTIDWSYSLLSDDDQTLFRRLSIFVGGCTPEAAEAVCSEGSDRQGEVLMGLESLADQSLLVVDERDGEPRFRLLETVREYALERLAASRETDQVRRRHAEVFLRMAENIEPEGAAGEKSVWLARLERENDNLRAALAWSLQHEGTPEMALRLAGALVSFWTERRHLSEGRRWLERALALATSSGVAERHPRAWAQVVTGIGDLAGRQGDFATSRSYAAQGVAIWRTLDDRRGLASALARLQWVMVRQGNHVQARPVVDELLDLSRDAGDVETTIRTLNALARAEGQQGNLAAARSRLEEALALSRQIGHTLRVVYNLCNLAEVAWARGDTAAQREFYDEALASARSLGDPAHLLNVLGGLAWLSMRLGEYEQAAALNTERLNLARRQVGSEEDWWSIAWIKNHLGDVARCQEDLERAVSLYDESLALFREHGERQGAAAALHNLGHVALSRGDARRAKSLFMESLSLFRELDFAWSVADCLTGLAGVAGLEGRPQEAALLYGAAEAAHEAIDASGMLIDPANKLAWDREMAAARGTIDEATWEQAWSAGRAMSLDQALTWADGANG
jgi:predicted ATPase/DNA-binding XRE family transcriptional regulator